jgi:hypothetical protein
LAREVGSGKWEVEWELGVGTCLDERFWFVRAVRVRAASRQAKPSPRFQTDPVLTGHGTYNLNQEQETCLQTSLRKETQKEKILIESTVPF